MYSFPRDGISYIYYLANDEWLIHKAFAQGEK